jgi:hypothetical protein
MDWRVKPGNDVIEIRSRDATGHPSYGKHGQMKRENGVQEKAGVAPALVLRSSPLR